MKKRLFISSILMTLVLLVAITTATFAWYQATNAASITEKTSAKSITTKESSLEVAGYYVKVELNDTLSAVDLTDPSGNGWVISSGVFAPATVTHGSGTIDKTKFVAKLYSDANMEHEVTSTDLTNALKAIGTKSWDIMATASGNIRLTLTEGNVYTTQFSQSVKVATLAINANGEFVVTGVADAYYSVSGGSAYNTQPVAGAAATDTNHYDDGAITFSLAIPSGN